MTPGGIFHEDIGAATPTASRPNHVKVIGSSPSERKICQSRGIISPLLLTEGS